MGVVEAVIAVVLEVIADVWEVFEAVRNAVSRTPDTSFAQQRRNR
jgi:hypothetical protein